MNDPGQTLSALTPEADISHLPITPQQQKPVAFPRRFLERAQIDLSPDYQASKARPQGFADAS